VSYTAASAVHNLQEKNRHTAGIFAKVSAFKLAMDAKRVNVEYQEPDPNHADPEGLRAWLMVLLRSSNVVAAVSWLVGFITRLWEIQHALRTQVQQAKRRNSRSEKLGALQTELPGMFDPSANDDSVGRKRNKKNKIRKKKGTRRGPKNRHAHGRPKLPEHLPRVVRPISVPPSERDCPCCQQPMSYAGVEPTERLSSVRHYVVERTEREVLRCEKCHLGKKIAPAPDAVVDRGILAEELLIDAMVDHYRDAVPFERMERDARAQEVPLSANTLARGVAKLIDLLDPIVSHISRCCMASGLLALDSTSMPVLDRELADGIRRGALWHLLGDRRWAYFGYAPTGHDEHLHKLAASSVFDTMLSDGASTHNVLLKPNSVRAGCNAHARSKLVAAARAGDARAAEGVLLYAPLFVVEAQSKRAGDSPEQRLARRQRDSRPHLDTLRAWVDARSADVEPRSKLGLAVGYMRRQWDRLRRFMHDGRIELTNNEVERDLRTWVLDRKTWLFCGHEQSAQRAAAALTVLVTCSKFGLDPRRYLRDVIRALLDGEKNLQKLLPENYVPSG
jgi:transposase